VQTGSGINAVNAEGRLDDIRSFSLDATTDIEQIVTNTGNSTEDLSFHFLINGGELALFSPSGNFDLLRASVTVQIFGIGSHSGPSGFLWWWMATLEGDPFTGQVTLSSELVSDDLGLGAPAISAIEIENGEASVGIAAFPAVIDLGTLDSNNNSTTVSYHMSASVSGPGLNRQGGRASLGDPFDITGNPGSIISIPGASPVSAVPEPASWSLLLMGAAIFLGLPGRLRRTARSEITSGGGLPPCSVPIAATIIARIADNF
jgi:hypothetical protein